MLDAIPDGVLPNLGAIGILSLAVLGVLRGWLVPGRSLDQMLKLHEERLAEERARGDEWKEAARLATARADERDKQTEKLLETQQLTVTVLEALRAAAERQHP